MKTRFLQVFLLATMWWLTVQALLEAQTTKTFTVCALNVDGLPQSVAGYELNADGPGAEGTKLISRYLSRKGYDILGVSEDFNYNGSLMESLGGYSCGTVRATLSLEHLAYPFDTDGLNLIWKNGLRVTNESWTQWNSSQSGEGNQFVKKGFRHYTVSVAEGMVVDVYVLHMDAGDREYSASREGQWRQLAEAINANPQTNRPKIIIGDTNSRYTREDIWESFYTRITGYTVSDAWVELWRGGRVPTADDGGPYGWGLIDQSDPWNFSNYEIVDKVIYLNPVSPYSLKLRANSFKIEQDYTYGTMNGTSDSTPLGDHRPVVVSLTATLPTYTFDDITDRWSWQGEGAVSGTPVYLYNVYWGKPTSWGDEGAKLSKGFLCADGTLTYEPAGAYQWYLWGDLNASESVSISNENHHLVMSSTMNVKVETANSGATEFTVTASSSTGGAYHFTKKLYIAKSFSWRTRFFNADSATGNYSAAANEGEQNDWLIISPAQGAAYERYNRAWDATNSYLHTTSLPEDLRVRAVSLLGKHTSWTGDTAERLEALNAQIEYWRSSVTGDVNRDGYISISDVTALVNIILGKDSTVPYTYDHYAADANGDGYLSISDVTAVVNIILGKLK